MPPAQSVVWFRSLLDRLRCHIFSASTEGIFTGEAVSSMASMLEEVYSPLINAQARLLQEMETSSSEPGQTSSGLVGPNGENIHSEFNGTMAKFEAHIQDTLKQLTGDVQLQVPTLKYDLFDPKDFKAALDDYTTTQQVETAMEEWAKLIVSVNETEVNKRPKGKDPIKEVEFWRQRHTALSTLYEQVNMPHVQKQIEVMQALESGTCAQFNYAFAELTKLHVEAKDNVKFLTTLERHFKNITHGSFNAIQDTLPSMMNAIRMVWIISRHYNTDERMVPLMERIAMQISEKVQNEVNVKHILTYTPEQSKKKYPRGERCARVLASTV